jgi:hypothetical protein
MGDGRRRWKGWHCDRLLGWEMGEGDGKDGIAIDCEDGRWEKEMERSRRRFHL